MTGGPINLESAELDLTTFNDAPASGDLFTLIANDTGAPVIGTFAGIAESATVTSN